MPSRLAALCAVLGVATASAALWSMSGASVTERWLVPLAVCHWVLAGWVGVTCVAAAWSLRTRRHVHGYLTQATIEAGVVLAAWTVGLGVTFSILEWEVWWSWDPRTVTAALMGLMFVGLMLLTAAVRDPDQRITQVAVATLMAGFDLPVVYEALSWWQVVHTVPFEVTTGASLSAELLPAIVGNGLAVSLCVVAVASWRYRSATLQGRREVPEELRTQGSAPVAAGRAPSV